MSALSAPAAAAAAAYRAAARIVPPVVPAATASGGNFADAVARALQSAVGAGRDADRRATAAIAGEGDVTELALAVSKAELALQTTVAVRDRLVSAYQDVMRMSI